MIKWLEDAVFYEVYPQSFRDSNGDGIGDIPGITEKLEYIQELGCNALWINPCFTSPFYDAGYDVEDYYSVAPRYGTNEDLKKLFEAAHQRGMHVLLDLVPGHTAVTHPWFQESKKAGASGPFVVFGFFSCRQDETAEAVSSMSLLQGFYCRPLTSSMKLVKVISHSCCAAV